MIILNKLDRGLSQIIVLLVPIMVGLAFFFITAHFKSPLWLSLSIATLIGLRALADEVTIPWYQAARILARYRKAMLASLSRSLPQRARVS